MVATGKARSNYFRSKSQGRGRSSTRSNYDSNIRIRDKRDPIVSDYVNKGLTEVGLKAAADTPEHTNRSSYYEGKNRHSRSASTFSSTGSDLLSSSDEERQLKKMRGKEVLSGILATATTIHAAHIVYKNVKRRRERKTALAQGEISPEKAKKERNRARLTDAAFMGIAVLGINSAVKEWKEKKERKKELREFREKHHKNHDSRLEKERRANDHSGSGRYGGSAPNLNSNDYNGSTYYDGNPYSAGPFPPRPPGPPRPRN